MIPKIWNKISIVCGCHKHPVPMEPHDGKDGKDMFYSCPKYYEENRDYGEKACGNRLSIRDYEKIVKHISDILEETYKNRGTICLTGLKWKDNSIEYEVIEHSGSKIIVAVKNNRIISV